ncbi:MAG: DUF721 domain-containing protein [Opitutales bacterium]
MSQNRNPQHSPEGGLPFSKSAIKTIADFKGVSYKPTRARMRSTMEIENLVDVLFKQYGIEQTKPERVLMEHWRDIMGGRFAHRCSPVKITTQGVLLIATSNASLRNEILFQKATILKKIKAIPECDAIRDIRLQSG